MRRNRLSVREIRQLLASSDSADPAVEAASALLARRPDDETVEFHEVPTQDIVTIYRRRVRWTPEGVLGDRALLAEVERLDAATLAMSALTIDDAFVWLWTDVGLDRLLGCITGTRRAVAEPDPADHDRQPFLP